MLKIIFRSPYIFGLALFIGSQTVALAQDAATVIKDDQLREQPFNDAKVSATVKRSQVVQITATKGAWLEVKAGSKKGWLRLLSVRRNQSTQLAAGSSRNTGRLGTGKIVATTGVRGLSAQELKAAPFDAQQLAQMESYQVSAAQAAAEAQRKGLLVTQFAELPSK